MSQSPLRCAAIGVGHLGKWHAAKYAALPDTELVAVVDADSETANRIAAEHGCRAEIDHRALIGQVDAVSIAAPTTLHYDIARDFLEAGCHVLVEKPITATLDQAETLNQIAEQQGVVLQVGHLERFNAALRRLTESPLHPRFIESHRLAPYKPRATDVSVVLDLMIHDIDIILALVDAELVEVRAVGTPVLTSRIDIASARLQFSNGTVANTVASRVSDKKTRRIRVFQPQGYLSLDFIGQTLDSAVPQPRDAGQRPEIRRSRVLVEPVQPLDRELEAFVHCVRTRERPLVDGQTGLRALDVALQIQASIAEQQAAMTPAPGSSPASDPAASPASR